MKKTSIVMIATFTSLIIAACASNEGSTGGNVSSSTSQIQAQNSAEETDATKQADAGIDNSKEADGQKIICKSRKKIGSLTQKVEKCATKEAWDKGSVDDRNNVDDFMRRTTHGS